MWQIRVPASSANLGPGFDCFGLALKRYLSINAALSNDEHFHLTITGEGADILPTDESNFIVRVARTVAASENIALPNMRLQIHSDIPLARGLGSSAAAITAGIALVEAFAGKEFDTTKFFHHSEQFEKHADNLSAARFGGFTLVCRSAQDDTILIKQHWPEKIAALVVIPAFKVDTESARGVLPQNYSRADAIFNLQHALLLQAALAKGEYQLLKEALHDRWHQPYRAPLVAGLTEALSLDHPGLLGVALSGSGPTLLALAIDNFHAIGNALVAIFAAHQINAQATLLEIDPDGRQIIAC